MHRALGPVSPVPILYPPRTFFHLLRGANPFAGDVVPARVRLIGRRRPAVPFPHYWNYDDPLRILDAFFWRAERDEGAARHNRYLGVPGLPLGLVTRDPAVIRSVLMATGDKPGQFDRDTWPTRGIARATGADTMLYANGPWWRRQKRMAAPSLSQPALFQPEKFHEFEVTFRKTVAKRLEVLRAWQEKTGQDQAEVALEPEISAVMLEMLVNNFFGGRVPYEELRERYVPAINGLIRHMVRDTIGFRLLSVLGWFGGRRRRLRVWRQDFERLTDIALEARKDGVAAWADFGSDAPDDALRSNIRVFLAGALEATTSMAAWALAHLSRRPDVQEQIHAEVKDLDVYNPENLARAATLHRVLEETLRLTPALYFLPRQATADTWIDVDQDRRMFIPKGTHVVLDVWHANRCEDFWGQQATGFPAATFEPERWEHLARQGRSSREVLHFGFGHGARVCPGKFLGLLEVGLVVGAFVKTFRFSAVHDKVEAAAGVSTKPADGALVRLASRI
jgi:cytochrome P450